MLERDTGMSLGMSFIARHITGALAMTYQP
jgi:hypothetical protein